MMLAKCQLTVQDAAGNKVDGATVTVTNELTGARAVPFEDVAAASPYGNPFVALDGADAGFFVVGGFYRIDVVKDGVVNDTLRWVAVGTAAGTDDVVGTTLLFVGAGDIVVPPTVRKLIVKKAVGAATNITVGKAADRGGVPLTVIDGKGDADTNNITFTFDGTEQCAGLNASEFTIKTKYGRLTLDPVPDGSGWLAEDDRL